MNRIPNTLLVIAVIAALGAPAAEAQQGQGRGAGRGAGRNNNQPRGPEATENFSRTVRIGGNGALDLQNLAGNVVVMGGGGNDVTIQAVKRTFGGGSDEQRRTRLQEVQIQVREQASRIEVRAEYPENGNRGRGTGVSIDYTIAVPQNTAVYLKTVSGDIRATNVRGDLRLETLSGDIQATGARRVGLLKTVSGNLTLTDLQTDEDVTVQTLSGDLTAQNVRARALDASVVSGDVRLTDIQSDRVMVKSLNGDITYTGNLQRTGRYEITTQSGDITVALSANGFDLEASTFNGDINSDFPVTLGGSGINTGSRRGPGQQIRAKFGDGGAALALRSFNGDIRIAKR